MSNQSFFSPKFSIISPKLWSKPAPILGHSRFSLDYQVLWQTIGFMFHFLICCSALIWEPCFRSQMWFFLRSNRTDKCGLRYPKIFSLQLCESILTYLLQYRWSHLSIVSIKLCVSMCEGPSQWLKCSFVNLRVKTYLSLKLLLECSVLDEGFLHVSLHVLHPRHMTLAL